MRGTLRSNRDFVRLWIGQSISQVGSQVTLLALPLIAIRVLDAGPFEVGVLAAAETAPFLLIGLPAGVWVDQWRRRSVLIAADVGRAAALATVPVAFAFDVLTMGQLYGVAAATGVLTVFFDVAYQSYLPTLVEHRQLVDANSRLELSRSAAQVAGPGLAGVLVQLVRGPMAIAADSVSFGVSALFVARIRTTEGKPVGSEQSTASMRTRIAEGLQYVVRHPLLGRIAATTAVFNFFSAVGMAVFLIYAVRRLGIDPAVVGAIFSIGSIGFVLGSMVTRRATQLLGVGPALALAGAVQGAAFLLVPLAPRGAAVAFFMVAFILEAVAAPVYGITQVSLRQTITPARMQGRTNATMRVLVWGALPLGSVVGGVVGARVGLRATVWVAALGTTVSVLPLLGPSLLRVRAMPDAQPED